MQNNKEYIYIRTHESYDKYNAYKLGKTINIPQRENTYITGEIKRGYMLIAFELLNINSSDVEKSLQNEFKNYNIKYDAGTEFYNKQIIELIEPYLIKHNIQYKKLTKEEINLLTRRYQIHQQITKEKLISKLKKFQTSRKKIDKNIWYERDYQTSIINYSKNELLLNNKIYIELPTGSGKSYIVYNLFKFLKSDMIIIVSPRKIVNSQNISQKYLQILSNNYITFNYSIQNNFNEFLKFPHKKIIICCTQSVNKIYNIITINNIIDITLWFDESHWGIEDWLNNQDNVIRQFLLLNNKYIKYRIFTSASPNQNIILQNENIFGKLYSPIKVKELINLNWLSPIKPYIYSENIENVDNIKYVIHDFNEKNRKFGFSFHNTQKNAFNLFYNHYIKYKNNETHIMPFLLVGDDFNIKQENRLVDISLNYEYRNIKQYENTPYSIGYIVDKYSMGYDFNKIDFIYFSDPKLSIKDIKQSIGRGLRPDEYGENGSNKYKVLVLSLPVYINDQNNDQNKYDKIIEVLKYLLYDIEISFEEIRFENRYISNSKSSKITINEYLGINDVKSILLNLLEIDNNKNALSITYERARKIIAEKNIKSKESYYELCKKDNRLHKEPDIIFQAQFTNWIDYLSIERVYYDLETCKNKVLDYLSQYPHIKNNIDLSIISNELCKLDNNFPPNDLWVEYYNVKDLRHIILLTNKIKKNTILL